MTRSQRFCLFPFAFCLTLAACGGTAASAPSSAPPASSAAKPSAAASPAAAVASSAAAKPAASGAASAPASTAAKPAASGAPVTAVGGAAPLSPAVKVPFGDNQTFGMAPIFIALDRGYFKAEGLDVETFPMQVTQVIQSLATNQVSFATANPDPALFNALDRGVDIKLLASLVNNKPGDAPAALLVRQDLLDAGKYKSPKDLKGLNVGIPGGASQSQFYINLAMKKDGLTVKDVNLININTPDFPVAFSNKTIDAAWTTEPGITVLQQRNLAKKVVVTGDLFPGAVGVTLAVNPDFAKNQPQATQRFVNAFLRGLRDYYHAYIKKDADKAPVVQTFVNHTPVKDAALYDQMGMQGVDPNASIDLSSWDVLQDFFVQQGFQPKKTDLNKYIERSYIDKAVAALGKE